MLVVIGTIRLAAGSINRARPAMAQMVAASRAEDGCIGYSYAEDIVDAGLIRVTELWRDQAALDRHFTLPHLAVWRAAWPVLGISDRQLRVYEVSAARET
ncbi:putative quinol monooxygenase [Sphingomonas sp. 28-63-12]|uniref:putative quinol monooxygenase n=1 Tax=Sphingomonas sp. 28-63-12 TaxID=1970434 RepID=UPI000BD4AF80|nr:MAG: antibiotic biosynthesis monooxygenase [Sphingomonas sp. 28-63-12]